MDDILRDIFSGLVTFFQSKLTGVDVKMAFKDERLETEPVYPSVTISWYDAGTNSEARYSGLEHFFEINEDGITATITRKPIPLNLYFQLDAYAEKRSDDLSMTEILLPLLGSGVLEVTTPAGRVQPITPFTADVLDRIEEGLFRKSYSFYTPVFFPNPQAAEQAYLALKHISTINGNEIITAEA